MAKSVFYDNSCIVNGTDLSDHVEEISLVVTTNDQFASAMGSINDYNMPGTLKLNDITAKFYQDYATSKVYATLVAAWAARSTINLVMKPTSGARSPTNPEWTVPVFIGSMPIMAGKRGDRHMADVKFTVAGDHSILTA